GHPPPGAAAPPAPAHLGSAAAPPPTLTGTSAQATQTGEPDFGRAAKHRGRGWKPAVAALAVAAALIAAGLAGWQAGLTGAATPRSSTPPSPPMGLISSARLTGQQAGVMLAELRRLGLRPRLAWVPTSAHPPGTVLSVQPASTLPPNTIITVTIAAQHGDQAGGGGNGNGGNEGSDGGGDGG